MKTYLQEKDYWVSSSGVLGKSFLFETLDLEIEQNLESLFDSFLKSVSQNVRVKLSLFQEISHDISLNTERSKALRARGFLTNKALIHFEHKNKISVKEAFKKDVLKREEFLQKRLSDIYESLDESFLNRMKTKPLSSSPFKDLYNLHKPLSVTVCGLKTGKGHIGILKLKNSGNHPLSLKSVALVLERIRKPVSFHISFEKLSQAKSEKTLKLKSREEAEGRGQVSYEKYQKAQRAISEVELGGEDLFHFEIHLMINRDFEDNLRRDIASSLKALSPLGEWSIESFGAYPSLFALSPGDGLHYKLIEKSSTLKCFFPCFRFGSNLKSSSDTEGSLVYHRQDSSLDALNPFSWDYSNHTGVIIGKSGKGKSVFANLLTKSINHDERASIFLVDVKGSHKKTVEKLGGKIYNIDIENSSGLNPLKKLNSSKESIEIAGNFIEKLLLENEEEALSSIDKSMLEKSLIQFAETTKDNPRLKNLDNFYNHLEHPKSEKLGRFIKGSLNENIFKQSGNMSGNRLLYFNFENISTASNSYIAKAIIAGLMAEFSFKLLNKEPQEKLIFISDETPFFIKSCFNTFSLLSKNVRKLNGSLILLAQNSKDLIFNGDTSLIDNSEFKILFSHDGEEKKFKETFNLTNEEFQKLSRLKTVKGHYSQFLLKDSIGSKVGYLRLSKEEYIFSNTEPEFLHKVKKLQNLFNITEDKALQVMNYV